MIKKRDYLYKNKKVLFVLKIIDFVIDLLPIKKRKIPQKVAKILLIKPDHLGDVLLLTSVLPLIQKKYPDAKIDIVIGSWSRVILKNNPCINKIYEVDHFRLNRSKKSFFIKFKKFLKDFFIVLKQIKKEKYDICINFRSYGDNLIILQLLSQAKYNIAFGSAGFGGFLDCEVNYKKGKHEVEYFLELLNQIGIKEIKENLQSFIYISNEDKHYVQEVLSKNNLENKEFIIIHPGSGDKNKLKDTAFWKQLINKIDKKIVFCGTKDEKYLIKDLVEKNSINLMGVFSISQLIEFYKYAKIIYTVDSLAGHLASMINVPTVSFYSDFTDTNRWRPIGKNVRVCINHEKYLKELK